MIANRFFFSVFENHIFWYFFLLHKKLVEIIIFVLCNINHRLLCTYFHLKHFIQMINKNEYFTWHLVGMNFVLHYFYGFCIILRFFWLYFLYFQYFFGFSSNFMIFITFFVISQVVINNIIERVFVLYISTVILYFVLLKSVNIISINSIKITRFKCRLFL